MNRKFAETVKSAVLAVLIAAMAVLAAFDITETQRLTLESPVSIDIDKMMTYKGSSQSSDLISARRVMPEFIGYCLGGVKKGCLGTYDVVSDLFNAVSSEAGVLLGSDSVCAKISDRAVAEKLWKSCYSSQNCVYMAFNSPLPAPVIYMYITGDAYMDSTKAASGDIAYISELFIIFDDPDESGLRSYHGVGRDGEGNVSYYKPKNGSSGADLEEIGVYGQNASLTGFEFGCSVSGTSDYSALALSDSAILTDSALSSRQITAGNAPALSAAETSELLKLFGYNPDRLNSYAENEGEITTYVETWGYLSVSSTAVSFSASDNTSSGISVSQYLDYGSGGSDLSVYELIRAAEEFIARLGAISPVLTGGDAYPVLYGVTRENGEVVLTYVFCFDGILLYTDGKPCPALTFREESGSFTEIDVSPIAVSDLGTRLLGLTQARTLTAIDRSDLSSSGETVKTEGHAILAYLISDDILSDPAQKESMSDDAETALPAAESTSENAGTAAADDTSDTVQTTGAPDEKAEPAEAAVPEWIFLTNEASAGKVGGER